MWKCAVALVACALLAAGARSPIGAQQSRPYLLPPDPVPRWSPTGLIVETIAGTGSLGLGDGGDGRQAVLANPQGLTALPDGSLLIADYGNDRIRRLAGGIITTIAGTGAAQDIALGDERPATQAVLRFPRDTAIGQDGSIYIADGNHYQVRRIDPQGIIHAFAGNRTFVYSGDNGLATAAGFTLPFSVAVDVVFGNVYITDQQANRVRRVDRSGIITTVAGTGAAGSNGENVPGPQGQLNSPRMLRIRDRTRLVIGSALGPVRELDLQTGLLHTLIPQTGLLAISPDGASDLVVASERQVWRYRAATNGLTLIAGTGQAGSDGDGGPATSARFDGIAGLATDAAGRVFISDANNLRIRQIGTDGRVQTIAGGGGLPGDGAPAASAGIYDSQGLGRDEFGNLYFTDFQNNLIRRLGTDGTVTTVAGTRRAGHSGTGGPPLQADLCNPEDLVVDRYGQVIFISPCSGTGVVRLLQPGADGIVNGGSDERILDIAGQPLSRDQADHGQADGRRATQAVFSAARDIALDSRGNLYIADILDHRVRMVTPGADGVFNGSADEIITTVAGRGAAVADGDGGPADRAGLLYPKNVAVDSRDNLYIEEWRQNAGFNSGAIRRVDLGTKIITTVTTQFAANQVPAGDLMITPADTLVYGRGAQLFEFDPRTGRSLLIAGTPAAGFAGDGGSAVAASFVAPLYFTIDRNGRVYLADNGNFRLRVLRPPR